MIELKRNQIIQTRNGRNYIIKNILPREGEVIAKDENKYEFFIRFRDFKVIVDVDMEEGG